MFPIEQIARLTVIPIALAVFLAGASYSNGFKWRAADKSAIAMSHGDESKARAN
jgi:hypothetical protein